ncbi:catenin alpha-2-like isoform X4, partial [Brachionus plicatilis]
MSSQMDKNLFEEKFEFILESLEPLINQILVPDAKFTLSGKSRSARHLIKFLKSSLEQFANKSAEISMELSAYRPELGEEISKFRTGGAALTQTALDFVQDPLNAKKRIVLGNQAKPVLVSMARILALFDLIDQKTLVMIVHEMSHMLKRMKLTVSQKDFVHEFKSYGKKMKEFLDVSQNVIDCMKISKQKVALISARSLLAKQSLFLYSSTLVFLKQPKNDSTRMLRDQVYEQTFDALDTIENILNNKFKANSSIRPKKLLTQFIDLETRVDALSNSDSKKELMSQLDDAIRNINLSLNQSMLESDRKESLVSECEQVRSALQHLFKSYQNVRNSQNRNEIENYKGEFIQKNRSIRRQIRQLVVENFSLISNQPLDDLIEGAKSGDFGILNDTVLNFEIYAKNLIDSSHLACALSTNREGIKLVELATERLSLLIPLVVKSAQVLCNDPSDPEAKKNMAFFRTEWLNQVNILSLSVDDIISINDFMAMSESQMLQDLNKCIIAMNNLNAIELKDISDRIVARTNRVCDLVMMEI